MTVDLDDRCPACGSVFADIDDDDPEWYLVLTCSVPGCILCTDCCGHDDEGEP